MGRRWVRVGGGLVGLLALAGCMHEITPSGTALSPYNRVAINSSGTIAGLTSRSDGAVAAFVKVGDRPVQLIESPVRISGVNAINDAGVVVGTQGTTFPENQSGRPFRWSPTTGLDVLPLPPGMVGAAAVDINNGGDVLVAGYVDYWGNQIRPFVYEAASSSYVTLPVGVAGAYPSALNDRGEVVGAAALRAGEDSQAVYWEAGTHVLHELDDGGAPGSLAADINESGTIVGEARVPNGGIALWSTPQSTPRFLGEGRGSAINGSGLVVGTKTVPSPQGSHHGAALWDPAHDKVVELGDYSRGSSGADDVNDAGVAVGLAFDGTNNGTMVVRWDAYAG